MKISRKINISVYVVIFALTTIFGIILYTVSKDALQRSVIADLESSVATRAQFIEFYLEVLRSATISTSKSVILPAVLKLTREDSKYPEALKAALKLLKQKKEADPSIFEYLILDKTGTVVTSTSGSEIGEDKSKDAYFLNGQKEVYIKDAYLSRTYNVPLLGISVPFFDSENGKMLGVLIARVTLDKLNNILTYHVSAHKTEEMFILNKDGYMITPSRFKKDTFLKQKGGTELQCVYCHSSESGNAIEVKWSKEQGGRITRHAMKYIFPDYRGNQVMGAYRYLPKMQWGIFAEIDAEEALAPLALLQRIFVLILLVLPLICWILGRWISETIVSPLRRLQEGVAIIGGGDLEHRVGINTQDEVGALSREFDAMSTSLKSKMTSIDSLAAEVERRKRAEAEAIEGKTNWEECFDAIGDMVTIHDADFNILRANKAAVKILGVSAKEIQSKKCFQSYHGTVCPPVGCPSCNTLKTGIASTTEVFEPHLNRFVEIKALPRFDAAHKIAGVVHIVRDITERKKAESAIQESQERLTLALEAAQMGVWSLDIVQDRRYFDAQTCRLLGLSPNTFTGTTEEFFKVLHPEDREFVRAKLERAIKEGAPYSLEYRVVWPDGSIHVMAVRGKLTSDAAGVPQRINGTIWDITQRRIAEEKLATALREEKQAREIMVSMLEDNSQIRNDLERNRAGLMEAQRMAHVGNWNFNLATKEFYSSEEMDRILGHEPNENPITYQSFVAMTHPEDLKEVSAMYQKAIQEGCSFDKNYRIVQKNGAIRNVHVKTEVMRDEGGRLSLLVGTAQDITEQKRGEDALQLSEEKLRQSQKMEAIGRLAGGVAHDFNNQLTVIGGYADFILSDLEAESPLRSGIEEIKKAADRSSALTRQLLAFSRRQISAPKIFNLNVLLTDIHKMLQRLMGAGVECVLIPGQDLWSIKFDPSQMEQVLVNFAANARDAVANHGKFTLETSNVLFDEAWLLTHGKLPSGEYVVLTASDNGMGMSEEVKARLFEPFFTTKPKGSGTGLGLSTIYGIVEQNGGHINVYSEVGKGTVFKIYIPRASGPADALIAEKEREKLPIGTETILLVEDEESVRNLTLTVLTKHGYRVIEADNGEVALRLLASPECQKIDMVLTDLVMPRLSGRELADHLKVDRPGLKILFMSGYTDDLAMRHGIAETAVNFLQKPFSPSALLYKVREVLGGGGVRHE